MDRHHWRRELRHRRRSLEPEERRRAEEKILAKVQGLPEFREAASLMIYIAGPHEVSTLALLEHALSAGKVVAGPHLLPEKRGMVARRIRQPETDLVEGPYGLLQVSPHREALPPEAIDLVIVPGLGFDPAGHRLGQGEGYYDRFLAGLDAWKVALAFEPQILPHLPSEPWDVRMDLIVTESRVIRLRSWL